MPDFDFDAFNHDTPYEGGEEGQGSTEQTLWNRLLIAR